MVEFVEPTVVEISNELSEVESDLVTIRTLISELKNMMSKASGGSGGGGKLVGSGNSAS